jgi:hypothetical protein
MPPLSSAFRLALVFAALIGGVVAAMAAEILLARHGIALTGTWRGLLHGGSQMHAAMAWWSITGVAFITSFVIAAVTSRFSWLYFRSLRWTAAVVLALALAAVANDIPPAEAGAAGTRALATLGAVLAAAMMAGFGAFFAVRR